MTSQLTTSQTSASQRTPGLGVAVIGAGMAGRSHASAYRTASTLYDAGLPPIRLVAISDVNEDLGRDTARRYGYERWERDWRALATDPGIDVVSIVVANSLHRQIAEELLAAGKHVLCEKPFAPTMEDAEAMVAAARDAAERGVQAAVGFTYRRSPAISAIKARLDAGDLGEVNHFHGTYWCDYACSPDGPMSWRYKGGPGTGALADIGSHLVDLAEMLCGPVAAVRGATFSTMIGERALPSGSAIGHAAAELSDVREPVENEDVATFTLTFASGASGSITASRVAFGHPNALGFEVYAQRGAAAYDLEHPAVIRYVDGQVSGPTAGYRTVLVGPDHPYLRGGLPMDFPGVGFGQNDGFNFQAVAFLDQIVGLDRFPRMASFADGLHNLRILDAVTQSAADGGREITLHLDQE